MKGNAASFSLRYKIFFEMNGTYVWVVLHLRDGGIVQLIERIFASW